MREIPEEQVLERIRLENPWWQTGKIAPHLAKLTRRAYFALFEPLVRETKVRRAVVLMGPRRVGKTVLIFQAIQHLIDAGVEPARVHYVSLDNPAYNALSLEALLGHCRKLAKAKPGDATQYFFFDEIQYLASWEAHLKSLVDAHPECKFVASGSAAAALRLKSIESGAGRFTDFLLPPLTFHEFLELTGDASLVKVPSSDEERARATDIDKLNLRFIDYLNFGGYPEAAVSKEVRADPERFIRSDIIDKVLLRDLPSLYGISNIQELNSLFTTLAYNTAQEVALEPLSKKSGVAKNTIKRYIEYLEAAFLIKRLTRIDDDGKRFQRERSFKVYLTTPSIRSALFTLAKAEDADLGSLVETAIVSQWFHDDMRHLGYARWKSGEVDLVYTAADGVRWATEIKWSDRFVDHLDELEGLLAFAQRHQLQKVTVTTQTRSAQRLVRGIPIEFVPASLHCFNVGRNLVKGKRPFEGGD